MSLLRQLASRFPPLVALSINVTLAPLTREGAVIQTISLLFGQAILVDPIKACFTLHIRHIFAVFSSSSLPADTPLRGRLFNQRLGMEEENLAQSQMGISHHLQRMGTQMMIRLFQRSCPNSLHHVRLEFGVDKVSYQHCFQRLINPLHEHAQYTVQMGAWPRP